MAKKLNGTYTVVNEENRMRGRDRAIKTLRRYEIVYGCVMTVWIQFQSFEVHSNNPGGGGGGE